MDSPLQTVIIPTYNRKEMLAEAIDSVLKQSQKSLEVIIVDDCSTDGTDEFVKTITDTRVRYFRNEKNSGPEINRSFGLRNARGKYITFLDDDDYYTDYDAFSKVIKIFEENSTPESPIAFISSNVNILTVETGELDTTFRIGPLAQRMNGINFLMKFGKPVSLFSSMFNSEILRKAGLDHMPIFDTETYLHVLLYGDLWFNGDVIGVYRVHKESITIGYKHNKGQEERYYAKLCEMVNRINLVGNELSKRVGKKRAKEWLTKWLMLAPWYARKTMTPKFTNKIIYHIFFTSGFMPRLWYQLFRFRLKNIAPLRKIYRFIKYRGKN